MGGQIGRDIVHDDIEVFWKSTFGRVSSNSDKDLHHTENKMCQNKTRVRNWEWDTPRASLPEGIVDVVQRNFGHVRVNGEQDLLWNFFDFRMGQKPWQCNGGPGKISGGLGTQIRHFNILERV